MAEALESDLAQEIASTIVSFTETDPVAKRSLLDMLEANPDAFCRAAMEALAKASASPGARYLVHLLLKQNLLIPSLTDVTRCSEAEAHAVVKSVNNITGPIENQLERALGVVLQSRGDANTLRVLRLLDLLLAIGAQRCWSIFQTDLFNYPDLVVRSKLALVLPRVTRSATLIQRFLLDTNPRVQANALEALWAFDGPDTVSLFSAASRSKNNRVAGNAAVGLYRCGDSRSVGLMFEFARHPDELFRLTGIWAMGETEDPRFLEFLTDRFRGCAGRERLAVTRALARIRRRERQLKELPSLEILVSEARATGDGKRKLVFALGARDAPALKPIEVAVSQGGAPAIDYSVTSPSNAAALVVGFVLPRFLSEADAQWAAVMQAIQRCERFKRADEYWRIDRYSMEQSERESDADAPAPRKSYRGFMTAVDQLRKMVASPGAREAAAADVYASIIRVADAIAGLAGERHLFVFLHRGCALDGPSPRQISGLTEIAGQRITVHLISPDEAEAELVKRFSGAAVIPGAPTIVDAESMPARVEELYWRLLNRYEVRYSTPANVEPDAAGVITITSAKGLGRAEFLPAALRAAD